MAVMGSGGLPAGMFEVLQAACARWPDHALSVALDGEEYLLLAARAGRVAETRVPRCVENNAALGAVVQHYFEELVKQLP